MNANTRNFEAELQAQEESLERAKPKIHAETQVTPATAL